MNKKTRGLIIGSLLGISVLGVTFAPNTSAAAEKTMPANHEHNIMMEKGQMGNMDMQKMMNSPEMQKKCFEMMKSPEMQQSMKTMMKSSEMQAMMKQMLAIDPELRQMMLDIVNSIDPNEPIITPEQSTVQPPVDHSMHH